MVESISGPFVFDTGPLSSFALNGWLGALKFLVGGQLVMIPDMVVTELHAGAQKDGRIRAILDLEWIEHRVLESDEELEAYAEFSSLLVRRDRNRGEAAVLALAKVTSATAVIDDRVGRKAAMTHNVRLCPTLSLLCQAVRDQQLTIPMVSALADDLLATQYHLPFGPGEFVRWAIDQQLLQAEADEES